MKIFGWFIVTIFIFVGIFAVLRFVYCGPNYSDMRKMNSMINAIGNYIVGHGIPKSLKDIPNLPYKLSGCKKNEYFKDNKGYDCISNDEARWHKIEEECHFENIKLEFWTSKDLKNPKIDGGIKMVSDNKTVMSEGFEAKNGKTFELDKIHVGSYKNSGICRSLRQ